MEQEKINENSNEIRIDIRVKEITKSDKTTFLAFKGLTKKGWYDLKFTKDVTEIPTKSCVIVVSREKSNINFNGAFPVIWVSEILRVEEYKSKLNMQDYFD